MGLLHVAVALSLAAVVLGEPRALWQKNDVNGCVMATVVVYQGVAVYANDNAQGGLYALNATSGRPVWSAVAGNRQWNSPATHDGMLFYQGTAGNLYGLNAATGKEVWHNRDTGNTDGTIRGAPAIGTVNGTSAMFVGGNANFGAYRLSDGVRLWAIATPSRAPPVFGNGVVYISTSTAIMAVDANTGSTLWNTAVTGTGNPVLHGDDLFVGSRSTGSIMRLSASDGSNKWTYPAGGEVYGTPSVDDKRVYFSTDDTGKVYALDRATGTFVWSTTLNTRGWLMASAALHDGILYMGGYGAMHTLDARTGNVTSRFAVGNYYAGENAAATLVDGVLYFGTSCDSCPCARMNSIYAVQYSAATFTERICEDSACAKGCIVGQVATGCTRLRGQSGSVLRRRDGLTLNVTTFPNSHSCSPSPMEETTSYTAGTCYVIPTGGSFVYN